MYSDLFKETEAVCYVGRLVWRFFLTEGYINFQISLLIIQFLFPVLVSDHLVFIKKMEHSEIFVRENFLFIAL